MWRKNLPVSAATSRFAAFMKETAALHRLSF
jgi:hypothetical protein